MREQVMEVANAAIDAGALWLAKVMRSLAIIDTVAVKQDWADTATLLAEMTPAQAADLRGEFSRWLVRRAIIEVDHPSLGLQWDRLKGRCAFALGKLDANPTMKENVCRSLVEMAERIPKQENQYRAFACGDVALTAIMVLKNDIDAAVMTLMGTVAAVAQSKALELMHKFDPRYAATEFAQEEGVKEADVARRALAHEAVQALINMIAATAAPEAKCA